jgi:hypothetical protein
VARLSFDKEVENNSIARLNAYARQYVSRSVHGGDPTTRAGNGGTGESYSDVVVVDVLNPVCVYTFICLENKKNIETVALGMFQKVPRTLMTQARFFFVIGKESLRGVSGPISFPLTVLPFLSYLLPTL